MAAQPNLFKFEDQTSISFAVPEEAAQRGRLMDRIEDHGGNVINNISEADFVILSARVATERLRLLTAQGCIVVDACWILECIYQQSLQPWYVHRLGVDEVNIPDQERDINELAFSLARFAPLSGVEEIYLHLAKQFPHRTSRLFRFLHHENQQVVDFKVQELAIQIGIFRPRMESAAASIPINTTNSRAERVADIRALDQLTRSISVTSGDDPEHAPTPMDDTDIIMNNTPDAVAQASLSDVVIPDTNEDMLVLPQQHLAPPAAVGPSATSQSGQIQGRQKTGTGKFVSSTGISVAAASAASPVYRNRNVEGRGFTQVGGSQGRKGEIGGQPMRSGSGAKRRETGKGRAAPRISSDQANEAFQFTSVTPPPDGGPHDPTGPDAKPLQHIITGPRQLLAIYGSPWRDPLPGIRGRDNVNSTGFPGHLKEAFCRRPRKPLPDEDLSADPTDIEAMARYLLSHDQGFFDEFYVDYRDGYKRERWDRWFRAHKDAIRACGINLLKHSDFKWNEDRQNVQHQQTPDHIQPTWSEELNLNLTPFEEELLAKEWNPVKDLEHIVDKPFCDYIAQQANRFLETRSLNKAGYQLRPRWAFLWTKRGTDGNEIKRRTARQWEHRFQKNDRVGELIGLEPEDWEDNSDDEKGCYCREVSHL